MRLSEKEIAGIGIALNEATLLGAEVDPSRGLAALTFSVLSLSETGPPPEDGRVSILLSSVNRVSAVLLDHRTPALVPADDLAASVTAFELDELLGVVESFRGCPVYGWEFVDADPTWETRWAKRLSLDWRGPGHESPHTLNIFQDANRYLSVRFCFEDFTVRNPEGNPVPLSEFIAGGRRWWDALYAGDSRTKDAGIFPLSSTSPKE